MANTSGSATAGQIFTFKLDKDDLNDLKQTIGDSRKQSLADALAVFAGRAKSVIGFAENKIAEFEKGYLNAQLAGTSSKDMRALEGAAQEFGVSAEAVRASVQALHRNARDDPQAAALLEKLYISASNGAGGQRDSIDLIQELGDALKNLTSQQASDAGNKLGMDPQLMEAMRSPGFGQQLSVMRDSLEDSKIEAAGERAHRIMKSVRDIGLSVDEMFAQALLTMADRLEPMLQSISAWFKENGAEAGKRLGEIGNLVLTVMSLFGPLISALTWLDGATGGLSSEIMLLVGGFLLLGGGGVVGALMSLFSSLGNIRGIVGALGPRLASMAGTIGSAVSRAWSTVSGAASSMFGSVMAQGRAVMTQLGGWAGSLWSSVGGPGDARRRGRRQWHEGHWRNGDAVGPVVSGIGGFLAWPAGRRRQGAGPWRGGVGASLGRRRGPAALSQFAGGRSEVAARDREQSGERPAWPELYPGSWQCPAAGA